MPSLIKFLAFCAIVVGIAYGSMIALIIYVEPNEREISVRVPADKLDLQ